jgi:F5/8 type C domain
VGRPGGRHWVAVVGFLLVHTGALSAQTVLDDFEDVSGWTATASDGARVEIGRDVGHGGMSLRIDFDLGAGGYVIVRKAFAISLPANYAFKFFVRGDVPPNTFQFKLVDRTGQNVWWYQQRDFTFPTEWRQVIVKKPRIQFAWGPAGGGPPQHIGYIEFAIAAGHGGSGSVWIDDFTLEEREPSAPTKLKPKVSASTSLPGNAPELVLDQNPYTSWHSGELAAHQWVVLDFVKRREYGGLVIDWDADYATAYQVQASDDGENWVPVFSSTAGNGGRDYVYLPDGESRYLRIDMERSSHEQGYGIREVTVEPFEFSASPNQFFEAIARDAPPGTYPKYFTERQTYWTIIGARGDDKEALMNEEGMLEVDKGSFSLEPFLFADGTLITWNSARISQQLERGYLPIPSVTWSADPLALTITAFAAGRAGESSLYVRYRVENHSDAPRDVDLFVAVRPFQVLPPWQTLNMVGGVTPIRDLVFGAREVWVNGEKVVQSLTAPDRVGAATFEEGLATHFLLQGKLPPRTQVSDPLGYASGAFAYGLHIAPTSQEDVYLAVPFDDPDTSPSPGTDGPAPFFNRLLATAVQQWDTLLNRVDFQLPPFATQVARTIKSTLAYILINRDGPAIQPGSRTYARSWIRDGAVTSTALLQMGFTREVREFIRWFSQYQLPDGRIPCCVDQRGTDSVLENDSNGEFIYTVTEYYRYTHDIGLVNDLWPAVLKAVDYLDGLRQRRLTDAYKHGDKQALYGLVPESISHEGYSSHPVHSYWDDFFTLRGFKDAVTLAVAVGDEEHARSFAAVRDAFRTDLYASITKTMADHKIDYLPASVEYGDFDPTSTAIALTLVGELSNLPADAVRHTFDKYYAHVLARQHGDTLGDAYTPYELRNVDALVMLGQRERAQMILGYMLADQRPPAWNEWAEIVWRDPSAPRFIGDMPHTWVASSFLLAVRSMCAYEREADDALVIGAGLPQAWLASPAGVTLKRLPTHYGVLHYTMRSAGSDALTVRLWGDMTMPPGKIVLQPPLPQPLTAVTVNGRSVDTFTADSATVAEFPAEVVLTYASPPDTPTAPPPATP